MGGGRAESRSIRRKAFCRRMAEGVVVEAQVNVQGPAPDRM